MGYSNSSAGSLVHAETRHEGHDYAGLYASLLRARRLLSLAIAVRATAITLLVAGVLGIVFLASGRPVGANVWVSVVTATIAAALLLLIPAIVWYAYVRQRRTYLARRLHRFGLRIDDDENLITDEAHYRVVSRASDRLTEAPKR